MEIRLRLKEVLEEHGLYDRGCINKIHKATGVDRHAISAMVHDEVKSLSLENLAAICVYLVIAAKIDPAKLPGILFRRVPGNFWAMLAARDHIEVCVGVRYTSGKEGLVSASDAFLQGKLLHGLSSDSAVPPRYAFVQHLVKTPAKTGRLDPGEEVAARDIVRRFDRIGASHPALIAIGVKNNPVGELILAESFGMPPFTPWPQGRRRADWQPPPFFWVYRADDRKPHSSFGGEAPPSMRLPDGAGPGLYYEGEDGAWHVCPSSGGQDAAVIFYTYRREERQLRLMIGGFSALATLALASVLLAIPHTELRPCFESDRLDVGAVIVRLWPVERSARPVGGPGPDDALAAAPRFETIRLSEKVLRRRLAPLQG